MASARNSTSRKASQKIEDLRAIPWVFSWSQCRLTLPGWYGFGAAVEAWLAQEPGERDARLGRLRDMHARWPFFSSMLSNMSMVLAKTDLAIASRYADLVPDAAVREAIYPRLAAEHDRTVRWVLAVSGRTALLDDNPTLARSIRNRFPCKITDFGIAQVDRGDISPARVTVLRVTGTTPKAMRLPLSLEGAAIERVIEVPASLSG